MGELSTRDLSAVLELADELHAAENIQDVRVRALAGLHQLVPSDATCYNEIGPATGAARFITDPPDMGIEEMQGQFLALLHQHPLARLQAAGDLSTRAISDFLSVRRFHALELYRDFYRLVGLEDQLAFGIGGRTIVAFTLRRGRRSFTHRDKAVLELLRPRLAQSHDRARMQERDRLLALAVAEELERRDVGVIELDEGARIVRMTGAASDLLEAYSATLGGGSQVESRLRSWLQTDEWALGGQELLVGGPRGQLRIRRLHGSGREAGALLLLEERRPPAVSIESLRELGLTNRQAQVLRLLALGRQSAQIAAELQIATATVEKHVERIYERIGARSRGEALARVYNR